MTFILGKKLKMSQTFNEKGEVIPVTLIEAGPCFVTLVRTKEKDGYMAAQVGFQKKTKNIYPVKSVEGKIKKTENNKPFKYLKEFRILNPETCSLKQGDSISVAALKEGDIVKVSGISKGKGFQGGVKKWGFSGRNATHGVKHEHRTIGSVGTSNVGRVLPGKKMPGRMGAERITVKNLQVVKVDPENNLLALKGAVPGRRGTLLEIRAE